MKRIAAAVLALALGANAMVMLAAGAWWYGAVPGVGETGPYNAHFVKDVGAAYLVAAAALAWHAVRPAAARGAMIGAAGFLAFHGVIHIADALSGGDALGEFIRDFPGVFLPAILAVWIAGPTRSKAA
jgi:hypothetical protein